MAAPMLYEVKVPMLAESISEARLLAWRKQVGEAVRSGEGLVDIETDKVTLEVSAPADGVVSAIHKPAGEQVSAEEVIAVLSAEEAGKSTQSTQGVDGAAGAAETAGTVETAGTEKADGEHGPPPPAPPPQDAAETDAAATPRMSPAVRALIEQHQLEPSRIPATGKKNRLLKEDVLRALQDTGQPGPQTGPAEPGGAGPAPPPTAPPATEPAAPSRRQERVPMSLLRRRVAERLLQAQRQNAILSTFNEVNMRPVMGLRQRYGEIFEQRHRVRLGLMALFTRAVIEGLKRFPILNAAVDGTDVISHHYYDIGIALSAPRGLVVPVLKNAESLSLHQIESRIREFAGKARQGTLALEDLAGGTFTITNGGVFGSLLSTPIINPPQSAILGMHRIQERPVVEGGKVVIRPIMYLAVSYDHRIIDGREAVQFLVTVKEQLEDPVRMLLKV